MHAYKNADLSFADLRDTFSYETTFENANLTGANLRNARLENANLSHAEFKDVDLSSTTIIDSICDHAKNLDLSESNEPKHIQMSNCQMMTCRT
jgi:uncharacterized protein YjbI with pentapeptide repeats